VIFNKTSVKVSNSGYVVFLVVVQGSPKKVGFFTVWCYTEHGIATAIHLYVCLPSSAVTILKSNRIEIAIFHSISNRNRSSG